MIITPLRVEGQPRKGKPLPLGLHVLHAYMRLKNGSSKVSLVVRNISDSHIFLKKEVPMARVVSASLVPPAELLPEMEAALGVESQPEPMSVAVRQEKLLEKLNLDGFAHWSPGNAAAARELVLSYHDVFALESNELGCTSAIKHEIRIKNSEPFKEWFWHIPPPLLEEVHASLRDMLEMGAIRLSQSPWCNAVVLVQKKDGTLRFCVNFRCLNAWMKKDSYPLLCIQEALESMVGSKGAGAGTPMAHHLTCHRVDTAGDPHPPMPTPCPSWPWLSTSHPMPGPATLAGEWPGPPSMRRMPGRMTSKPCTPLSAA